MALGIIAQGEGTSINGVNYRVRIYSDSTAASLFTDAVEADGGTIESEACLRSILDNEILTLKLAPPIFNLTYEPETDDIAARLIPSNIELFFYNDSDEIDTLLDEILENQEVGYYLTIEQQDVGKSTYVPYWKGVIMQDQIEEIEASKPRIVALRAIDGLSALKDVDYDFTNEQTTGGKSESLVQGIIYKCLEQVLPAELWPETTDIFLNCTVNWWATNLTYSSIGDPLRSYLYDVEQFQSNEEVTVNAATGDTVTVTKYFSCFEVLDELAKVFICRIYMAEGAWFFEQMSERRTGNTKRNRYNKNNTGISNGLIPSDLPISGARGAVRLRDNQNLFFPALSSVQVFQQVRNSFTDDDGGGVNLAAFVFPRSLRAGGTNTIVRDLGLYDTEIRLGPSGPNLQQTFILEFENRFNAVFNIFRSTAPNFYVDGKLNYIYGLRAVVNVQIKVTATTTANVYYLQDNFLWGASANTIGIELDRNVLTDDDAFITSFSVNVGRNTKKLLSIVPLPEVGRIEVTVSNWQFERLVGTNPESWTNIPVGSLTSFLGSGIIGKLKSRSIGDGLIRFFDIENSNAGIRDNTALDYGTIIFYDGAIQRGMLFVNPTGSVGDEEGIDAWQYSNEAATFPLAGLVATERMKLQKDVLAIYDGRVQYVLGYNVSISFDGQRLLPTNYTFSAFTDSVEARWFVISRFTVSETVNQDLGPALPSDPASDLGGSVDFFGKTISKNALGPFLVLQNETGLTAPFRTTAGRRDTIKTITAEAGQSESLTELDEVVYIVWSGANGTFALRLPELNGAISGIRLVVKLDDDFTGSQEVQLTPEAGQTINGEVNLNISGSGSAPKTFTLWGIGANWVL